MKQETLLIKSVKKSLGIMLLCFIYSTGYSQLSGTYSIGTGQDYETFAEVCSDLEIFGVSGALVFNVSSGTYTEQFTVPYVANSSETNTITIQSATGNADDVIIQYEASSLDDNYLIKVKQNSYLSIKNISFNALGDVYATAIRIENYAYNLTIDSCKFSGNYDTNNRERNALIAGSDIALQHLTISNNHFVNGAFAVFMNCSAEHNLYTEISNNTMVDMGYNAIHLNRHEYSEIFNNTIRNSSIGIKLIGSSSYIMVHSNKILNFGSVGIDISNMKSAPGFESYIYNNTAIGHQYADNALKINSSSYVNIYNNTLVLDVEYFSSTVLLISYSINQTMNVINNNIVALQQSRVLYVLGADEIKNCDYNNMYSAGRMLAYWGEECEDLRTLKEISGKNEHSIFAYPNFISDSELIPNSAWLDGAGTPLASVTEDIVGFSRDIVKPDIGAYEFEAAPTTKPALNGIKTIGAGGDYTNLNDAISDVQVKGIDASLRLQFLPAYYNEQCIIPPITGANSNQPLILESSTSNSNDVHIWYNANDADDNYILKLAGSSFLQIKNLSLHAMDSRYASIIDMWGMVDSLLIQNCSLHSTEQNDANDNAIVINVSDLNFHLQTFEQDSIFNGSTTINMNMDKPLSSPAEIRLVNNYFESGYQNIITRNVTSALIKNNHFKSKYYGLSLYGVNKFLNIERNYINARYGGFMYLNGISFEDFTRGRIINNFMLSDYSNPNKDGLQIYMSDKLDIYYNSISMLSERDYYPCDIQNSESIKLLNNIFSNKGPSYCMYTSGTSFGVVDYNCFYSQGPTLAYWNSSCTDLAALKTASSANQNSLSVNPGFTSATDLHIITDLLDGKGTPITGIEFDFDGQSRDLTNPDIGADEFGTYPNQPPVVDKAIPDQSFEWNSPPQEIALLDTVFSDPDPGDILNYMVDASENWVLPTITNNILTVATSEGSSGTTEIVVTAFDQMMAEVSDTFLLEYYIPAENSAPVAVDDTVTTHEALTIEVLLNDYDPDDDDLIISGLEYHGSGFASITADKKAIMYNPVDFSQTPDTIVYIIEDPSGAGDTAMVFIHLYQLMEGLHPLETELEGLSHGTIKWGDYDDDGDLDLLQTGWTGTTTEYRTRIISNTGDGFETSGAMYLGVSGGTSSSAAWVDFDNDNDLDICVAGRMDGGSDVFKLIIYQNNEGSFTHYTNFDFVGTTSCSMNWGDINGDGFKDIFISGAIAGNQKSWVYMGKGNVGSGWEFVKTEPEIIGAQNGEVSLTDVDLDGDLDFFICGGNSGLTRIYLQQEEANEEIVSGVAEFTNASAEWADFDADGDPDLAIMGRSNDVYKCQVYENMGYINKNTALLELYQEFQGMEGGDIAWADFDNDGDLDLAVTGNVAMLLSKSKILLNTEGVFTEIDYSLKDVGRSALAWGDYDNDGDLDLVLQGINMSGSHTIIYRNDCENVNLPPVIIGNTRSSKESGRYTISWDPATDDITPQDAISYNVRLGTTQLGSDIISPMSVNGFLKTPALGNAGYNTFYELPILDPGEYYFSVQAIDQAYAASSFFMDAYLNLTGIYENTRGENLQIFPNPSKERIWISMDVGGDYYLKVLELSGREVLSKEISISNNVQYELSLENLKAGIYIIRIKNNNKTYQSKLILH